MEDQNAEIIIYQKDFRKRTKEDDGNHALFEKEAGELLDLIRNPPREIQSPGKIFALALFIKNIAADLRGQCACFLSADRLELKVEIIVKDFSLIAEHRVALSSLCKDLVAMQIRSVDGEIVLTARYQNEAFSTDEELVKLLHG